MRFNIPIAGRKLSCAYFIWFRENLLTGASIFVPRNHKDYYNSEQNKILLNIFNIILKGN